MFANLVWAGLVMMLQEEGGGMSWNNCGSRGLATDTSLEGLVHDESYRDRERRQEFCKLYHCQIVDSFPARCP